VLGGYCDSLIILGNLGLQRRREGEESSCHLEFFGRATGKDEGEAVTSCGATANNR